VAGLDAVELEERGDEGHGEIAAGAQRE